MKKQIKNIVKILIILAFLLSITIKTFWYSWEDSETQDNSWELYISWSSLEEWSSSNTFSWLTLSWNTLSWVTLSWAILEQEEINVKYYSWIFEYNWSTFGNWYYDDSMNFPLNVLEENNIEVFTREEYESLNDSLNTKKSLKTNSLNLKPWNTMSIMSTSTLRDWLVGEWKFDWFNANDTSGNNFHWVVWWYWSHFITDWNHWWVYSIDWNDNYIYVTNSTGLTSSSNFSYWLWYKSWPSNWHKFMISKYNNNSDLDYEVQITDTWRIRALVNDWNLRQLDSVNPLSKDKWYFITVTFWSWILKIYVDWVLSSSMSWIWTLDTCNSYLLFWQRWPVFSNAYPWDWKLDNIFLYNRTLSSTEIQELYYEWLWVNNNTSTNLPNWPLMFDWNLIYSLLDKGNLIVKLNDTLKQMWPNQKADELTAWDPVNLATWEFDYENTLISLPWTKLPYEFKLNYKNQTYYNWPVWINWDHNYNIYLNQEENENILLFNWKLWTYRFKKNWSDFQYNIWLKANLSNSWWIFNLNFDDWTKYTFNSENKISKLQDKYWNTLNFTYNSENLLEKVTDTLWKEITYEYDNNRLIKVTDPYSSKVELSYFTWSTNSWSLYDLREIKIKNWSWTENSWNTKTIKFEYSTWWTDETNHNITKLFDSKNQIYVTNTYEQDRVKTQKYWSWTITYNYTLSGSQITKNSVTDKNWNITEYTYDSNLNNTEKKYYSWTWSVTYYYSYNSSWSLISETKPNWNWTKYSYDTRWNILETRQKADMNIWDNNDDDLITTYTYNSRNQILTLTNPNWTTITNTYDTNWNLTESVNSWIKKSDLTTYSITKTFEYNSNWELIKSIDKVNCVAGEGTLGCGNGNQTNYSYSWWLLIQTISWTTWSWTTWTWTNTRTTTISYNNYWIPTSITDARWNTINYELTNFNQVWTWITSEGIVKRLIYDENNNTTKEEVLISTWTTKDTNYTYDLLDEITQINTKYDTNKNVITNLKYDNNWNLIEKQTWSWAKVKYSYNNFAKVIEERIIKDENDNSKDLVTTYTYDNNQNIISKTNSLGKITNYEYDSFDRLTKEILSDNTYTRLTYNKDNSVSQILKYSSWNTLLSKSQFVYNWNVWSNKIVKEISYKDANNSTWAVITNYDYDLNSNLIKKVDPKWNETTFTYDEFNNLVETIDSLWNKVINTYDKNNNLITKTIKQNNNNETTTTYVYDEDNRLISETNELNKTKHYTYNNLNQVTQITDEEWNITNYAYDYNSNVKSETKTNSWNTITKTFTYDERWNNTSITDWNGNITIYEYNNLNQLIKTKYPDNKEITYTYDKNWNLKTQTDPNWNIITNTYDDLNRLIWRTIQTWTWVIWITSESYTYDDLWRLVEASDDNNHILNFTYDDLNRLINETQSWKVIEYTYDDNSNLTSITNPNNKVVNYDYDELDRLMQISQSWITIASYSYTWILNDSMSYWNWINISKSYDELNRLENLNNWVKTYNYTYDDVSNITSDNHKNFTYDDLYRLTRVNENIGSWNLLESYGYDNGGNRTSSQPSPYQGEGELNYITNNLNQYTSLSWSINTSFTYDNNWNLTNDWEKNFIYDYKNRLIKVENWSWTIVEYNYDVLGRRYEKKVWSEVINYVYSNENVLTESKTKWNLTTKKEYINWLWTDDVIAVDQEESILSPEDREELDFCEDRVLWFSWSFEKYWWNDIVNRCESLESSWSILTTNRYYYHKDHLWSMVGIFDNSWSIITEYSYDSYWNFTLSWINIGNSILFTWREYDEEIWLYYFRARYYSSELWRFVSRDPIGQVDDVNLYAYVGNNPVNFIDPSWTKEKSFLANNEWNVWVFNSWSPFFKPWHTTLYFIYWWQDYLLSYFPSGSEAPFTSTEGQDMFFSTVPWQNSYFDYKNELKEFREYAISNYSKDFEIINLWKENVNIEKLYSWYVKETSNMPDYNTFLNNCSDEVRKALVEWEFLTIWDVNADNYVTTPSNLSRMVKLELFFKSFWIW
jgi:RHS repeat-associated protein